MLPYLSPFESVQAIIVFAVIICIVAFATYRGAIQQQRYNLQKLKMEQTATKESKTIELQTINAKTALVNASTDPQKKQFPVVPTGEQS